MVKQLVFLSIFSLMHVSVGMDALWIEEEDSINISSFTFKIQQRYYYLARLEPIHELLNYIQSEPSISSSFNYNLSLMQATHPHILSCIKELQRTRSFDPLFELWNEFKSYKHIDEQDCLVEYATLVCIIAQHIMIMLGQENTIDSHKVILQGIIRSASPVRPHDIAYRYYILKRLKNVTKLLKHCSLKSYQYPLCSTIPQWSHPAIIECIHLVEETETLTPLLELIKDMEQYAYITDLEFMHELLEVIVFIEQHALAPLYLPKKRELCAHYEHPIDGLTIEELLQSIDILTSHIDPYAFDNVTKQVTIPQGQSFGAILCAGFIAWYASHAWGSSL